MKKVVALLLSIVMVLGICGCSFNKKGILMTSLDNFDAGAGEVSSHISFMIDIAEVNAISEAMDYYDENNTLEGFTASKSMDDTNLKLSLNIDYTGVQDADKNSKGEITMSIDAGDASLSLNNNKVALPCYVTQDMIYLESKGTQEMLGKFLDIFGLSSFIPMSAFDEYFNKAEYVGIPLDVESVSGDNEVTIDQIKVVAEPLDELLLAYFKPFVTVGKGEYNFKFTFGDLEDAMKDVYDSIDKNPKKFFDALVKVAVAWEKSGIDNDSNNDSAISLDSITEGLKKVKESRDNFLDEWKDTDFDDFMQILDDSIPADVRDFLSDTGIEYTIKANRGSVDTKLEINVCMNGSNPCVSLSLNSAMNKKKIDSLTDEISKLDYTSLADEDTDEAVEDVELGVEDLFGIDTDYDTDYTTSDTQTTSNIGVTNIVSGLDTYMGIVSDFKKSGTMTPSQGQSKYQDAFLAITDSRFSELKADDVYSSIEDDSLYVAKDAYNISDKVDVRSVSLFMDEDSMNAEFSTGVILPAGSFNAPSDALDSAFKDASAVLGAEIPSDFITQAKAKAQDGQIEEGYENSITKEIKIDDDLSYAVEYWEYKNLSGGGGIGYISVSAKCYMF